MRFGAGERWCLIAALLYACTILITDWLSHSAIDTPAAGILLAELPEQKVRKKLSLKKRAVNHT